MIAAVSRYAVAGGLELALMCDMRVAEEDATFGVFCRRFGECCKFVCRPVVMLCNENLFRYLCLFTPYKRFDESLLQLHNAFVNELT